MRALSAIALIAAMCVTTGCGKKREPLPPLPPEGEVKRAAPKPVEVAKKELPKPEVENQPEAAPPKKNLINAVKRKVDTVELQNFMRQIGLANTTFINDRNRPPKDLDEFVPYLENNPRFASLLKDGDIVIAFNTLLPPRDDFSKTPFAWEPTQDLSGQRIVLMFDGSIVFVPEAEFQALPKAKSRK